MYRYKKYTPKHMKPKPSRAQRVAAGAMSTVLGISMSIPFGATAALADEVNGQATEPDATTQEGKSQTAKKEVVYTKTDATGNKSGIYVVNYWNTQAEEEVSDPGTYTQVQNLSTTDALSDEGGAVQVTTTAGAPFYYQGDLDASTQLPWNVSLTYRLDGKVVSPDQLAGQDGDLDIELKVDSLDDDSATSDFAKSFLLQAQGTFNNDNLAMDDTDGATVATSGNNTVLTYLVLPGESGDWHIKGKATDFTYSGWQIAAMPLDLAVDINDYDTSQLTDAAGELEDGTSQLADGAAALKAGLSQLDDGASSAPTGSNKLADGAAQLADGTAQAVSGSASAAAGGSQVASGASDLYAGLGKLQSQGTSQVAAGAAGLKASLDAKADDFVQLQNGAYLVYQGVDTTYTTLSQTLPGTLAETSKELATAKTTLGDISGKMKTISGTLSKLPTDTITTQGEAVAADLQGLSALGNVSSVGTQLTTIGQNVGAAAQSAGSAAKDAGTAAKSAKSASDDAEAVATALKSIDTAGMTDAQKKAIADAATKAGTVATEAGTAATNASTAAQSAQTSAVTLVGKDQKSGVVGDLTAVGSTLSAAQQAVSADSQAKLKTDTATLVGTLTALQSTASGLTTTATEATNKANGLIDSSTTMVTNLQTQMTGMSSQVSDLKKLDDGAKSLYNGTKELTDSLTTVQTDANGTPTSIYGAASALASGSATVDKNVKDNVIPGAKKLAVGASALSTGLDTLSSGSTQLNDGAKQVASGSSQLSSGLSTLKDGTASAYDGSVQLSDGATELADAVSGIDQKVLDEVQDTIDEKLGKNYALHSFVDPSNTNVEEVQFVYVVSGVSTDDSSSNQKASDDSSTQDQSFADRLGALFSDDKKDE